jgi:hypothetical protein
VTSPIVDEIYSKKYDNKVCQGNNTDPYFVLQSHELDLEWGDLNALDGEITTKENCPQFQLQGAARTQVLELPDSGTPVAAS